MFFSYSFCCLIQIGEFLRTLDVQMENHAGRRKWRNVGSTDPPTHPDANGSRIDRKAVDLGRVGSGRRDGLAVTFAGWERNPAPQQ